MKHDLFSESLRYSPCNYGASKMLFRGPKRKLTKPYVAFVGGTETYGKFIAKPFPDLVEGGLRTTCVNFGCVNGGVDAFVNDSTVMETCREARATVVQVMGANFLTNRFYSVHPRRNDRFLGASSVLKAIYHDVDFSKFSFTRHMLGELFALSPERFDIVVAELREAWTARMHTMLTNIGPNNLLLWFARTEMSDQPWRNRQQPLQCDPLFITAEMIDGLRPLTKKVIEVVPSNFAASQGTKGMHFTMTQSQAAAEMLSVASHHEAAQATLPELRSFL